MTTTQTITVDITNPNITPPPRVYVKQGDSKSRTVIVNITDKGLALTDLSASCRIYYGANNGSDPVYVTGDIVNGVLTMVIPQSALVSAGTIKTEIQILDDDDSDYLLATMTFEIIAERAVFNEDALLGTDEGSVLTSYIEQTAENAKNAEQYANDANSAATAANYAAQSALSSAEELTTHNTSDSAHEDLFSEVYTTLGNHNQDEHAHSTLFTAVNDNITEVKNAMAVQNTASGTGVVRIDDVSPFTHNLGIKVYGKTEDDANAVINGIKVYGKNLCPKLRDTGYSETRSGVTATCNSDGSWSLSGQATAFGNVAIVLEGEGNLNLPEGSTITLSGAVANGALIQVKLLDADNTALSTMVDYGQGVTATVPTGTKGIAVRIQYYANWTTDGITVKPQIEVGDTATDFEEYTEPQAFTPDTAFELASGNTLTRDDFAAVYPTTTVIVGIDNEVNPDIDVTYNQDIVKAIYELKAAVAAQA